MMNKMTSKQCKVLIKEAGRLYDKLAAVGVFPRVRNAGRPRRDENLAMIAFDLNRSWPLWKVGVWLRLGGRPVREWQAEIDQVGKIGDFDERRTQKAWLGRFAKRYIAEGKKHRAGYGPDHPRMKRERFISRVFQIVESFGWDAAALVQEKTVAKYTETPMRYLLE